MPSISFLPTTAGRRRRPTTSPRSGSAATADAVVWIGTVDVGVVVLMLLLWWSRGSRMVHGGSSAPHLEDANGRVIFDGTIPLVVRFPR